MATRLLCVIAVVAVLGSGCSNGDGSPEAPADTTGTTAESPGPGAPAPGSGVEITVTGRVTRLVEPHVYFLGDHGTEPVLLVVASREPAVRIGTTVKVTGSVRRLVIEAIEEELGIALDERRTGPLEGQPALVARRVDVDD